MRVILFVVLVACGGPQEPVLAHAPHPDNAAVAGGAAAAAAAMTLADPDANTRGKPEKREPPPEKQPIDVKEQVPASVLDNLDHKKGSGATPVQPAAAPAKKEKGPPPKIPTPKDAAEHELGN